MECLESNFLNINLSISLDKTNGLIFNNVLLPEEIVLMILSYSDMETVLICKNVCKKWNNLIKSHHFWKLKLARINKKCDKMHPWYTYYMCFKMLDINLLKNGNGEEQFKYWNLLDEENWTVENPPQGANPLPANIPEFNGNKSCFASAYPVGTKWQSIEFKNNKVLLDILDEFQPKIYISEWFCSKFEHYSDYILVVKLFGKNKELLSIKTQARQVDPDDEHIWEKIEMCCENYGKGLCEIQFSHGGNYRNKFCASKMAGGVVKILFDFL